MPIERYPDYNQLEKDLSDEWTPEKEKEFLRDEGEYFLSVLKKSMKESSDFPDGFRLEDFSIEGGRWTQEGEPETETTKKVVDCLVGQGKLEKRIINGIDRYTSKE